MIEVTAAPAIPEDFLALILDHVKVETGDEEDAFGDLVEAYAEAAIARVGPCPVACSSPARCA